MNPLWLVGLTLAGAVAAAAFGRRRVYVIAVGLATTIVCYAAIRSLAPGQSGIFLQQEWVLDSSGQVLLAYMYATTTILLLIAAANEQAAYNTPVLLAAVGLFAVLTLLRSQWLSLLILPAAMLVPTLGTLPASPSAARGATRYLIWVTLPIPFLLVIPALLGQMTVRPQEVEWVTRSAWLVLPAALLWLNLFPVDAATSLWASDGAPLMPSFVWLVQQVAVLHLLLRFWQAHPSLWTQPVLSALEAFALLTILLGGVSAVIQASPSAVLGKAAMVTMGIAVLGVTQNSAEGLLASGAILAGRSSTVLLACATLAALYQIPAEPVPEENQQRYWQKLLLMVLALAITATITLPALPLSQEGAGVLGILSQQETVLQRLWQLSLAGIVLGQIRTIWLLWKTRLCRSMGRVPMVSGLPVALLLLWCLYLALEPQVLTRLALTVVPR